jgi:glycosyltransferase involved in cell wall biosynthesis
MLHRGTQAAARNVGLAHSKGNYVLFLDSDQQLGDGVVEDCVTLCSTEGVDAVKIPEIFVGQNFWGKCSALWKNSMVKAWGPRGGIPRFFRKRTLLKQVTFNDALRWWEDMELYQRLQSIGLRETWSAGQVIHFETDSPQSTVRKYFSYGESISAFKTSDASAPYAATVRVTLSTVAQMLSNSGRSISVFLGCLFLVTVKTFSAALGFCSR